MPNMVVTTHAEYGGYNERTGFVLCVEDDVLNAAMRGEAPPPDFNPLLEWIDEHKIQVKSRIPEIHYLLFVF